MYLRSLARAVPFFLQLFHHSIISQMNRYLGITRLHSLCTQLALNWLILVKGLRIGFSIIILLRPYVFPKQWLKRNIGESIISSLFIITVTKFVKFRHSGFLFYFVPHWLSWCIIQINILSLTTSVADFRCLFNHYVASRAFSSGSSQILWGALVHKSSAITTSTDSKLTANYAGDHVKSPSRRSSGRVLPTIHFTSSIAPTCQANVP